MECVQGFSYIPCFLNSYNIRKHEIDIYYLDLIINVERKPHTKTFLTS